MANFHQLLVTTHIAIGAFALILFWVPVFSRKGGKTHISAGKLYVAVMYCVSVTAITASLMVLWEPLGIRHPDATFEPERATELARRYRNASLFLLMLGVLVFASLRHGVLAIRERRDAGCLRRRSHRLTLCVLGLLGIAVGLVGITEGQLLLSIFSLVSISAALASWRDTNADMRVPTDRIKAHIGSIIGSGIGAYTAFFAFGGARLLGDILPGQWQILPWVLPTVIGVIATTRAKRPYRKATRARD